jgi:nucleoside-diphosphate-sugar epimerase
MEIADPVLVTGATGFVGRALCRRLATNGRLLHCLVRRESGIRTNMVEYVGDIADARFVSSAVAAIRPRTIFHLAAHVTGSRDHAAVKSTFESILVGTLNVFDSALATSCARIVTMGSLQEPDERSIGIPNSPYAAAKHASSTYSRMYAAIYQLPVTIARVFMVYGPDQPDATKVIPYVITRLLSGSAAELSSGTQQFDWVYVDDVVDALLVIASRRDLMGETIDVGTGQLASVRSVAERLAERFDARDRLLFGRRSDRAGEPTRTADVAATEARIGWRSRYSLDEGLNRTVAWYRAQSATRGLSS